MDFPPIYGSVMSTWVPSASKRLTGVFEVVFVDVELGIRIGRLCSLESSRHIRGPERVVKDIRAPGAY